MKMEQFSFQMFIWIRLCVSAPTYVYDGKSVGSLSPQCQRLFSTPIWNMSDITYSDCIVGAQSAAADAAGKINPATLDLRSFSYTIVEMTDDDLCQFGIFGISNAIVSNLVLIFNGTFRSNWQCSQSAFGAVSFIDGYGKLNNFSIYGNLNVDGSLDIKDFSFSLVLVGSPKHDYSDAIGVHTVQLTICQNNFPNSNARLVNFFFHLRNPNIIDQVSNILVSQNNFSYQVDCPPQLESHSLFYLGTSIQLCVSTSKTDYQLRIMRYQDSQVMNNAPFVIDNEINQLPWFVSEVGVACGKLRVEDDFHCYRSYNSNSYISKTEEVAACSKQTFGKACVSAATTLKSSGATSFRFCESPGVCEICATGKLFTDIANSNSCSDCPANTFKQHERCVLDGQQIGSYVKLGESFVPKCEPYHFVLVGGACAADLPVPGPNDFLVGNIVIQSPQLDDATLSCGTLQPTDLPGKPSHQLPIYCNTSVRCADDQVLKDQQCENQNITCNKTMGFVCLDNCSGLLTIPGENYCFYQRCPGGYKNSNSTCVLCAEGEITDFETPISCVLREECVKTRYIQDDYCIIECSVNYKTEGRYCIPNFVSQCDEHHYLFNGTCLTTCPNYLFQLDDLRICVVSCPGIYRAVSNNNINSCTLDQHLESVVQQQFVRTHIISFDNRPVFRASCHRTNELIVSSVDLINIFSFQYGLGYYCSVVCPDYFENVDGVCVRCSKFTDLVTKKCSNSCTQYIYRAADPLHLFDVAKFVFVCSDYQLTQLVSDSRIQTCKYISNEQVPQLVKLEHTYGILTQNDLSNLKGFCQSAQNVTFWMMSSPTQNPELITRQQCSKYYYLSNDKSMQCVDQCQLIHYGHLQPNGLYRCQQENCNELGMFQIMNSSDCVFNCSLQNYTVIVNSSNIFYCSLNQGNNACPSDVQHIVFQNADIASAYPDRRIKQITKSWFPSSIFVCSAVICSSYTHLLPNGDFLCYNDSCQVQVFDNLSPLVLNASVIEPQRCVKYCDQELNTFYKVDNFNNACFFIGIDNACQYFYRFIPGTGNLCVEQCIDNEFIQLQQCVLQCSYFTSNTSIDVIVYEDNVFGYKICLFNESKCLGYDKQNDTIIDGKTIQIVKCTLYCNDTLYEIKGQCFSSIISCFNNGVDNEYGFQLAVDQKLCVKSCSSNRTILTNSTHYICSDNCIVRTEVGGIVSEYEVYEIQQFALTDNYSIVTKICRQDKKSECPYYIQYQNLTKECVKDCPQTPVFYYYQSQSRECIQQCHFFISSSNLQYCSTTCAVNPSTPDRFFYIYDNVTRALKCMPFDTQTCQSFSSKSKFGELSGYFCHGKPCDYITQYQNTLFEIMVCQQYLTGQYYTISHNMKHTNQSCVLDHFLKNYNCVKSCNSSGPTFYTTNITDGYQYCLLNENSCVERVEISSVIFECFDKCLFPYINNGICSETKCQKFAIPLVDGRFKCVEQCNLLGRRHFFYEDHGIRICIAEKPSDQNIKCTRAAISDEVITDYYVCYPKCEAPAIFEYDDHCEVSCSQFADFVSSSVLKKCVSDCPFGFANEKMICLPSGEKCSDLQIGIIIKGTIVCQKFQSECDSFYAIIENVMVCVETCADLTPLGFVRLENSFLCQFNCKGFQLKFQGLNRCYFNNFPNYFVGNVADQTLVEETSTNLPLIFVNNNKLLFQYNLDQCLAGEYYNLKIKVCEASCSPGTVVMSFSPLLLCDTCKTAVSDGVCVSKCKIGQYIDGNRNCISSQDCSNLYIIEEQFVQCVDSCPSGFYEDSISKQCIKKNLACQNGLYQQDDLCVAKCDIRYINANVCYSCKVEIDIQRHCQLNFNLQQYQLPVIVKKGSFSINSVYVAISAFMLLLTILLIICLVIFEKKRLKIGKVFGNNQWLENLLTQATGGLGVHAKHPVAIPLLGNPNDPSENKSALD